jgi:hypothetical protein
MPVARIYDRMKSLWDEVFPLVCPDFDEAASDVAGVRPAVSVGFDDLAGRWRHTNQEVQRASRSQQCLQ